MNAGKFITVEGSDGAGKSTQLAFIEQWLKEREIPVVTTREPGGTSAGESIRTILLNSGDLSISDNAELLLMFAARMQHLDELILPAIREGKWVLCDRFTDATFAYQGGGREIDSEKIEALENWVQNGFHPDLTLLFDVPVEVGLGRVNQRGEDADRFEQQDLDFKQRVRQSYLDRARAFSDRISVIDASVDVDRVTEQVSEVLEGFLARVSN